MTKREHAAQSFTSPSPGAILKRQSVERRPAPDHADNVPANNSVDVSCDPFAPSPFVNALRARGVMLAPLLVQWNYKIHAALPFSKWLKTKEVLLTDARFMVNHDTAGTHYFGTYILQDAATAEMNTAACSSLESAAGSTVNCQTLWGYSDEAAMRHMFDLCRGRVDRISIVQNDLKDFVAGLKGYVDQAGQEHFMQTVLVAPAAA